MTWLCENAKDRNTARITPLDQWLWRNAELYLMYDSVRKRLEPAGCAIARSLVGNFVTARHGRLLGDSIDPR